MCLPVRCAFQSRVPSSAAEETGESPASPATRTPDVAQGPAPRASGGLYLEPVKWPARQSLGGLRGEQWGVTLRRGWAAWGVCRPLPGCPGCDLVLLGGFEGSSRVLFGSELPPAACRPLAACDKPLSASASSRGFSLQLNPDAYQRGLFLRELSGRRCLRRSAEALPASRPAQSRAWGKDWLGCGDRSHKTWARREAMLAIDQGLPWAGCEQILLPSLAGTQPPHLQNKEVGDRFRMAG